MNKYIKFLKLENVKRIFSLQSKTITAAAIVISLTTLASRFLGMIRDHILAGKFGAGQILDIYYASFRVPDTVYNILVLGALSAGFIPIFTNYLKVDKDNKEIEGTPKAWELVNNILIILIIFVVFVTVILGLSLPYYIKYIVKGFSQENLNLTIQLTQVMFISPILLSVSGIFGGILQSFKRFVIYSLAPIFYNIGIIIGGLYLYDLFGLIGLGYGVILGAFMHMVIQIIPSAMLGYRFKFFIKLKDKGLRLLVKMMVPRTLALAVTQINLLVITYIATSLEEGSLSVFNFANNLIGVPLGLFGISFAVASFPTMAYYANEKNWENFTKTFSTVCRQILFFIIPITFLYYIFRAQIVRLVLGSGKFDWSDTVFTLNTLGIFTISLLAQSLIPILARTFYTIHDTKRPFYIAMFSMVLNVILSFWLAEPFGVLGLAMAFSAAAIIQFILLWIFLHQKVGNLAEKDILKTGVKICAASIVMGIFAQGSKIFFGHIFNIDTVIGIFSQTAIAGTISVLIYLLMSLSLKIEEIAYIKDSLQRKLFKKIDMPRARIGD